MRNKRLVYSSFLLLMPFFALPWLFLTKAPETISKEANDPIVFQDVVRDAATMENIEMPVGVWSYTNKKNQSIIAIKVSDSGDFTLQILLPKYDNALQIVGSVIGGSVSGVFKIKGSVLIASDIKGQHDLLPASGLLVVRTVNEKHLVLEDDKSMSTIYFDKISGQ